MVGAVSVHKYHAEMAKKTTTPILPILERKTYANCFRDGDNVVIFGFEKIIW
ncbi:hypothetical protein KIM372_17600 [Bombiscardovia nodaiensis]|uniref:Uncharacterized protein n=1 Tax=Bombiscardovia nodaiensis TaxID=2932181 RepID=A0ABM8BAA7_9BIFI|nr:hypothetical protein KIM372_17600 [Bombiscardovia nodaiensis]